MNDDENPQTPSEANAAAPAKADKPPDEAPKGQWKMPEPVFRQTSGKLPAGYEKKVLSGEPQTEPAPVPAASPALDIQAQPDVSEEFTHDEIFAELPTEERPKRTGMRLVLAILAILGMVAIGLAFLAIVLFLGHD